MSFFNEHPITNETTEVENLFQPLGEGVYTLTCISSQERKTKDNDDQLALIFQVENSKRQIFANFLLFLSEDKKTEGKAKAVNISQSNIKSLCERAGIPLPLKDSQALLGATITTRVVVKERKDKPGVFQNEIVFQQTKAKAPTATAAPQAAAAKKDDAPW